MTKRFPRVNVDILVIKENKILLGLLSKNCYLKEKFIVAE